MPVLRARVAALEHKALPYEEVLIDLKDKPAWYLEMVPTGLVPAVKIEASGEVRGGAVVAGPGLGLVTVACCGPELRLGPWPSARAPEPGPEPEQVVWESADIMRRIEADFSGDAAPPLLPAAGTAERARAPTR